MKFLYAFVLLSASWCFFMLFALLFVSGRKYMEERDG